MKCLPGPIQFVQRRISSLGQATLAVGMTPRYATVQNWPSRRNVARSTASRADPAAANPADPESAGMREAA